MKKASYLQPPERTPRWPRAWRPTRWQGSPRTKVDMVKMSGRSTATGPPFCFFLRKLLGEVLSTLQSMVNLGFGTWGLRKHKDQTTDSLSHVHFGEAPFGTWLTSNGQVGLNGHRRRNDPALRSCKFTGASQTPISPYPMPHPTQQAFTAM